MSSWFLRNEALVGQLCVTFWGGSDVTVWPSPWVLGFPSSSAGRWDFQHRDCASVGPLTTGPESGGACSFSVNSEVQRSRQSLPGCQVVRPKKEPLQWKMMPLLRKQHKGCHHLTLNVPSDPAHSGK